MGPRQCTTAGMCSTKALQWGPRRAGGGGGAGGCRAPVQRHPHRLASPVTIGWNHMAGEVDMPTMPKLKVCGPTDFGFHYALLDQPMAKLSRVP